MQTLGSKRSTWGSTFCQQKGQLGTTTLCGIVPIRNQSSCVSKSHSGSFSVQTVFTSQHSSHEDCPYTNAYKDQIRRGAVEVFLCRAEGGRASPAQSSDSAGYPCLRIFRLHDPQSHRLSQCLSAFGGKPSNCTHWTDTQELQEF